MGHRALAGVVPNQPLSALKVHIWRQYRSCKEQGCGILTAAETEEGKGVRQKSGQE